MGWRMSWNSRLRQPFRVGSSDCGTMRKVRLTEVGESVRLFLNDALAGDGALIEDESGRTCGRSCPSRWRPPWSRMRLGGVCGRFSIRRGAAWRRSVTRKRNSTAFCRKMDDRRRAQRSERIDPGGEHNELAFFASTGRRPSGCAIAAVVRGSAGSRRASSTTDAEMIQAVYSAASTSASIAGSFCSKKRSPYSRTASEIIASAPARCLR